MRKVTLIILGILFIAGSVSIANANLILNPSYENFTGNNFSNWTETSLVNVSSIAHTGFVSACLPNSLVSSVSSEIKSDKFNLELGLYEYGAWFKLESAVDPTGISPQDRTGVTTNIYFIPQPGGPADYPNRIFDLASFPGVTWTLDGTSGHYFTNWLFFRETFNVAQPVFNAELNLYLQNYNSIYSAVYVDDAFVNKVPEPATMFLLGFALVGLAGVGRKFKK